MRVHLSDRERALLLALLRQPAAGVVLERLPRCVGWRPARVAEVLAPLVERGCVEVAPPHVRVVPWAAAWLDHEPAGGGRWWRRVSTGQAYASLGDEPPDVPRGGERTFVLTGPDIVWRELHRRGCGCAACRDGAPPTGTRPRPAECSACKGRPLPRHWECLRCGRGGRDALRRALARSRTRCAHPGGGGPNGGQA
jgi:hypothetical protein